LALPNGVVIDCSRIDDQGGASILRPGRSRLGAGTPESDELTVEVRSGRAVVSRGDWQSVLTRRQSQIVLLLTVHESGLNSEELGLLVYGEPWKPVTLRSEVSRLRGVLGPVIAPDPYRFVCPVRADRAALQVAEIG